MLPSTCDCAAPEAPILSSCPLSVGALRDAAIRPLAARDLMLEAADGALRRLPAGDFARDIVVWSALVKREAQYRGLHNAGVPAKARALSKRGRS